MTRITVPVRAPEFPDDIAWLQGGRLTMAGLRSNPVLIDFWDYTCVNCLRTIPYLREWHSRYANYGLVIVGVHSPEFAFAHEKGYVARAVEQLAIEYPVVLDNNYQIWDAYCNRYWPAKYLVDKDGYVRAYHFGEGAYQKTESMIQNLLRDLSPGIDLPEVMAPIRPEDTIGAVCYRGTPELYLGHLRGRIGNAEALPDKATRYREALPEREGHAYLGGDWLLGGEALSRPKGAEEESCLYLRYSAREVNLVAYPPPAGSGSIEVVQDGHPLTEEESGADIRFDEGRSFVLIDEPRMYALVNNDTFGTHELTLAMASDEIGLFAFTFVTCVSEPSV
jgi:thiol-disulfide isomerase/thioredoxin